MTNELKIDIKRTGFPVKIGTVELWFDSSLENLKSFFQVEEIAQKKLEEAQEKAKHIHFPEDMDEENMDAKTVDAAFDVEKEFLAAQYDIIFGDGSFKKVYKKYPDFWALEETLDTAGVHIAKRIGEIEQERLGKVNAKKEEYLNKKAKKK